MRSNTVAFRGTPAVVGAYEANDMTGWAIVCGKDIMFAYEGESVEDGAEMLREVLTNMSKGSSTAAYSLRCYKLTGKQLEITSATAYHRAFPFKLYEEEDMNPFEAGRRHYKQEADERLQKMQEQIDLLMKMNMEDDSEPDEPEGVNGFIAGVMKDPMIKQVLAGALAGIVRKFVPMPEMPAMVAGVGPCGTAEVQSVLEAGQPEKVQQAVNILCAQDPKLGDDLMKLATIALNNPGQFSFLLNMLRNS
jgi:hypothetical protein